LAEKASPPMEKLITRDCNNCNLRLHLLHGRVLFC
jgi:hypothetical protein